MNELPPSLKRYEAQLMAAVARDSERTSGARLSRSRGSRTRKAVLRVAAVGVVAAGIVAILSVAGVFGGTGPSIIDQAVAAIAPPTENSILHVDMIGMQHNPDGTTFRWEDESWQASVAPYARRQIETTQGSATTEISDSGTGVIQLYDGSTGTIYQMTQDTAPVEPAPKPSPADNGASGTDAAGPDTADGGVGAQRGSTLEGGVLQPDPTPAESSAAAASSGPADGGAGSADAADSGAGQVRRAVTHAANTSSDREETVSVSLDDVIGQQALATKLKLSTAGALKSGEAKIIGHVSIDGRDGIRIALGRNTTYVVDAETYAPLEWRTEGNGAWVTLRFKAYEQLPVTQANEALLEVRAQHPNAKLDTDPAHYNEATGRLFPNG